MRISEQQLQQAIRAMTNDELATYLRNLESSKTSYLYQSNPVAQYETDKAIDMAKVEIDQHKDMDKSEAKYRAEIERINQQYQRELKAAIDRNTEGYLKAKGEIDER